MKKIIVILLCAGILSALVFAGCSKSSPSEPDDPNVPAVEKIFYVIYNSWDDRTTGYINTDGTGNSSTVNTLGVYDVSVNPNSAGVILFTDSEDGYQVYSMDSDTYATTKVTYSAEQKFAPHITWDDSKIAMHMYVPSGANIFTADSDGADEVNITNESGPYNRYARFSHDGSKIVYIRTGSVYTMDANGANPVKVGPAHTTVTAYSADWSPDGSKIVYTGRDTIADTFSVIVMDNDGSNETVIKESDYMIKYTVWLYRTNKILYDMTDATSDEDVYIIKPDGTGDANLTNCPSGKDCVLSYSEWD